MLNIAFLAVIDEKFGKNCPVFLHEITTSSQTSDVRWKSERDVIRRDREVRYEFEVYIYFLSETK